MVDVLSVIAPVVAMGAFGALFGFVLAITFKAVSRTWGLVLLAFIVLLNVLIHLGQVRLPEAMVLFFEPALPAAEDVLNHVIYLIAFNLPFVVGMAVGVLYGIRRNETLE
jgi:hypothetical protein